MHYLKVVWKHQHPDEPVVLYSELDEARWEVRKVDVFHNGSLGYADRSVAHGSGTFLALAATPALAEIASDPEFEPTEITAEEFEEIWRKATHGWPQQLSS
jgi:hypothetical protein